MAFGLPDNPRVAREEFVESLDDDTCPVCGFDVDDLRQDPHAAYQSGNLLAVEKMDGSPYQSMGGAQVSAYYWKCPGAIAGGISVETALDVGDLTLAGDNDHRICGTYFTTEEETTIVGGAA